MKTTLKVKDERIKKTLDKNDFKVINKTVNFTGAFQDIDVRVSISGIKKEIDKALKKLDVKTMKSLCEISLSPHRQTKLTEHIGGTE